MMEKRIRILTLFLLLLMSMGAQADIVVVVNKQNNTPAMSHRELVDLFMGRNLYFADGSLAMRLDQAPDSVVRERFFRALVNKSVAEVNAYWARLLFTGRASPPNVVGDSQAVLKTVRSDVNAIGYIDRSDLDDTVRVVGSVE